MSTREKKKDRASDDIDSEKHKNEFYLFEDEYNENEPFITDKKNKPSLYDEMCKYENYISFMKSIIFEIKSYCSYQILPIGDNLEVEHLELFFENLR